MPSPNSTFTELVTTTWRNHSKKIKDNISNNNALYRRLMKRGRTRKVSGGLTIVEPLDYAQNNTYQRYSGYDTLNITASDVLSAAEYAWRQIAINITASGQELRINNGDNQIVDLAKARITNAMRTFANNFSFDLYSDGTLPNQISGLQALVADAGTGTVGGINSATWAFWQNLVQSAAAPIQGGGAVTMSATTIESQMLHLWLALCRGDDKPDLLVADNNYFALYEASQVSIKRYTASDDADGGFTSLKYKGADLIFDGGSGILSDHMYFLNTNYMNLCVHPDADLAEPSMGDALSPYNQDAVVIPVLWMGNQTISNRQQQGVMKA